MIRRVDPRLLDGDPFWGQVRRRQPDVDIVLLPTSPPTTAAASAATDGATSSLTAGECRAIGEAARDAWRVVLRVGFAPLGGASGVHSVWRARAGGHALVLSAHRSGIDRSQGVGVLQRLLALGQQQGWSCDTSDHPRPGLRAHHGLLALRAEAGTRATTIELSTSPLVLSAASRDDVLAHVQSEDA